MSRQGHETQKDLIAEREIAEVFAKWSGTVPKKLPDPPLYTLDYAFMRGNNVVSIAEIKDRKGWRKGMPDVYLSLSKVERMVSMSSVIKTFYVVRLDGWVHWVNIGMLHGDMKITWNGHANPRDNADKEPIVHIPISWFRPCTQ